MVRKLKEQYGEEVAALVKDVKKAYGDEEVRKVLDKFIDKYGEHKGFFLFVGLATVAFDRKEQEILDVDPYSTGGLWLGARELARVLSERNEKVREEIVKIGGKVERMTVDKSLRKFIDDDILNDDVKFNAAVEKIRKGGLNPHDTAEVMDVLSYGARRFSKESRPIYEGRMRILNETLATEFQNLNNMLACEKNRAQFKGMRAA